MRQEKKSVDPISIPWYLVTRVYAVKLLGGLIAYFFLRHFWGRYMLTSFSHLEGDGQVSAGLNHVWFISAWALGLTLLMALVLR